jgi:glycerol-3-phosphate dehydrogenase
MSSRAESFRRMQGSDRYDLLVVGGGITGCGVAYEAASRGAQVLLLEQADFAWGTSSRSTKLIHGGIRYLKQLDLRLVREGVRERQRLMAAAPHLVHPVQFVYPVHDGDPDPLLALRLGLVLYDWFAGRRNLLRHKVLTAARLLEEEPLLRPGGLRGGALYADCLTDDARLTMAVARAAEEQGAVLVNYMAVRRFLHDEAGRVIGVEAADRLGGEPHVLYAPAVLNATGPWVDRMRELDEPGCRPVLRPTKGVHLAVPYSRLPIRRPVVMHAADRRLMFAVPRDGLTYLGTTDTDYQGDPGALAVGREEVCYILNAANRTFPNAHLVEEDVISAWAGLRTLAATSVDAGPSQVSRDYKLHTSRTGLLSVAGGKLTAFQAMARAIVRRMLPQLHGEEVALDLAGAVPAPPPKEAAGIGSEYGLSGKQFLELWSRHGAETPEVLTCLDPDLPQGRIRMLAAEAVYAVAAEFAVTLSDVLNRRTAQLLFSTDNGLAAASEVAAAMGRMLGWDQAGEAAQLSAYRQEVAAMLAWRTEPAPVRG